MSGTSEGLFSSFFGGGMVRQRNRGSSLLFFATIFAVAGCYTGPSVNGGFSRTYKVSGPVRLELSNASGEVDITEGAAGTVSIHAEVRSSGLGFENPQKRLDDIVSDPPLEQRGDTIRVGKDLSRMRNVSISYKIQVPHDTEVDANVASGAENVRDLRGPVKVRSASGSIKVEKIDRDAQLSTASGTISAEDIGGDVQVSSASGNVSITNIKGDARVHVVSGVIRISQPGGRVDGRTTSGEVEIQGAGNDVTAHSVSGRVYVQGNPGEQGYWNLRTASGGVQISIPPSANFHLSAEAVSGQIRTDVPIVVEEQGKHSLRARLGSGGGRVEVHTVSGEIRVSGT
jgi:DUF4097 and DUF4098 domain-containing protein YvlB